MSVNPPQVIPASMEGGSEAKLSATTNKKRPILIIVVVVLLLAAVVGALYFTGTKSKNTGKQVSVCTNTFIIQNVNPVLQQQLVGKYQALAKQVQAKTGYAQDPNCLYVVTVAYAIANDPAKAQSTYNQLKAVYDPKVGFSSAFSPKVTLDVLTQIVNAVKNTTNGVQTTGEQNYDGH